MDEQRKQAYRYLLYWAMLDMRPLWWAGRGWRERLNPFCWWNRSRQARCAGAIAEWLHNLALFSVLDFTRFDEDRFWRDCQWIQNQNPGAGLERYRAEFERRAAPTAQEACPERGATPDRRPPG
jgi:hypothetical protein